MEPINMETLKNSLSIGSKNRLQQFVHQLALDRDKVIYDDRVIEVLKEYAWRDRPIDSVLQYLAEECKDSKGKAFSQSLKEADQLLTALRKFSEPNYTSFRWNRNYRAALEEMINEFSHYHLKPLVWRNDDEVIQALPKATTHSGFSFILTGKKKKGEYKEGILKSLSSSESEAKEKGSFNKVILPGVRTQCSGAFEDDYEGRFTYTCKHKTRLVSMIDIMVILSELRYAKPFQDLFGGMKEYAGGKDNYDLSKIITNWRMHYNNWVTLDYSSYDQSISNWLIEDAFSIVKSAFSYVDEDLWRVIVNDFIYKNFVSPDGSIIYSSKGVPSGSMFTQIIDSICNLLIVRTYLKSQHISSKMIVMGDDNLMFSDEFINISELASYFKKNFGIKVNAEKSTFGSSQVDPEFLSRRWTAAGQWRHPNVVISKLAYPERFRRYNANIGPEMVLLGYIMQYKPTMSKLMDIDKFMVQHPIRVDERFWEQVDHRYIPGSLAFIREYTKAS